MNFQLSPPLHHCLSQRAAHLGHPATWDWVLRDPVVNSFAPALPFLEDAGLIELDDTLRQTCQGIYWQVAAQWVRREAKLKPLLAAFGTAGIDVIPLKGAALLESLYPKIGMRSMADVDILVRDADYIASAEILLAYGLQPKWATDTGQLFEFQNLPVEYWPGELSFYNRDGLHIDMHRDLVTYHWFKPGFPVDIDDVWARSLPNQLDEETIWTRRLSPHDMLAHLCLHLGLHGLQMIKNFFDVDQFLRKLPADWDWTGFLDLTHTWGLRSVVYHVFTFCQGLFNTPVPDHAMDELSPGLIDRWVLRRLITPQALLADRSTLGKRYPSLVKFVLFDGFAVKRKTLRNLLFPSNSWLRYNPIYHHLGDHWLHLIKVIWRGD